MNRIDIEILSETPNCPVIRMPQRKFPGLVLQGDSLRILLDLAEEVCELCRGTDKTEAATVADSLREKLSGYVAAYEEVMQTNGLSLPYSKGSEGQ